jgi:nucleotide-binding universal stress UspA family protein
MTVVLAALDNSMATNPVLVTARALARVLGARVGAIHVVTERESTPHDAAAAAGVPLRVASGSVVDRLIEAAADDDVAVLVIGARSSPSDPRPLGSTAFAVATSVPKPVVVVPPVGRIAARLRRVLVPLEGTTSTSLAPRSIIELAPDAEVAVIGLHVDEGDEPSAFADRPQHEEASWARAFLARYCPWGIGTVQLERRVGPSDELVPLVAEETRCDLIALGWSGSLAAGRAPVVRAALERSRVPVMLMPVQPTDEALAPTGAVSARGGEE